MYYVLVLRGRSCLPLQHHSAAAALVSIGVNTATKYLVAFYYNYRYHAIIVLVVYYVLLLRSVRNACSPFLLLCFMPATTVHAFVMLVVTVVLRTATTSLLDFAPPQPYMYLYS